MPRQAQPEPLRERASDRAEAEWADLELLQPRRFERTLEWRRTTGPPREDEGDRGRPETARRKDECVGRGRVEPLDVVDRDQQRLVCGERSKRIQEPERDRSRRGRDGAGLHAK